MGSGSRGSHFPGANPGSARRCGPDQVHAVEQGQAADLAVFRPDEKAGALVEAEHLTLDPKLAMHDFNRRLAPLGPKQPVVVHGAKAFVLPGVEVRQEMRRERLQKVGARNAGSRLLLERGRREVLPVLAPARRCRDRRRRPSRRAPSSAGTRGAARRTFPATDPLSSRLPGQRYCTATLGGHSEPRLSPSATIMSGPICSARSSATSGSSTIASCARPVLRLHTTSPAPSSPVCARRRASRTAAASPSRGGLSGAAETWGRLGA